MEDDVFVYEEEHGDNELLSDDIEQNNVMVLTKYLKSQYECLWSKGRSVITFGRYFITDKPTEIVWLVNLC